MIKRTRCPGIRPAWSLRTRWSAK